MGKKAERMLPKKINKSVLYNLQLFPKGQK